MARKLKGKWYVHKGTHTYSTHRKKSNAIKSRRNLNKKGIYNVRIIYGLFNDWNKKIRGLGF